MDFKKIGDGWKDLKKILFKWVQSGISNFKRLKVISKTRDIVQKRESFYGLYQPPKKKNEN